MVIISGSFYYTMLTNKRIDRLDDRILQLLDGQYRMSAKVDYIIDQIDGKNNVREGSAIYPESNSSDSVDRDFDNTRAFIRTCYLLLFDQGGEEKNKE